MSNKKNDKNQQNPVDKIFRESLHDRSFEFDEKYWENAQDTLSNFDQMKKAGKRKRNRKFWLLGGFFIGAGILMLLLFKPWMQDEAQIAQKTDSAERTITNTEADKTFKQLESSKSSEKNSKFAENSQPESETISQTTDNQLNTKKKIVQKNKPLADKLSDFKGKAKQKAGEKSGIGTNKGKLNQNQSQGNNSKATETNNTSDNFVDAQQDELPESNANKNVPADTENAKTNADVTQIENTVKHEDQHEVIDGNEHPQNPLSDTLPIAVDENETINFDSSTITPPKIKSKMDLPVNWFAEGSFGVDIINRNLSTTNPALNDWITYRNANEIIRPTLDVSINGGAQIKNFTIASGANFYAYAGDVDYGFTSYVNDTTFELITDSMGIVTDSFIVITTDTIIKGASAINRLNYLEIPLILGYRYSTGKLVLGIQTGPAFAILTYSSIVYPTTDLNDVEIIDKSYFRNTSFNWIAKPSVHYLVNENIGIGISGLFRWNLGTLVQDEQIIERYNSSSIQMGIYYKF